jgi:hypothetical protein
VNTEPVAAAPPDVLPGGPAETPPENLDRSTEAEPILDAYTLVIDAVLALLKEPQSDEWLSERLCVRAAQVKDWLDRGVREGRLLKLKKPVRYVTHTPTLFAE